MARTPEFDHDQVLDAALQAFWEKGYEATSLNDLLEATGLARQSLYNTFGDKRGLFLASLRRYADVGVGRLSEALEGGSVRAAIRGVLRGRAALRRARPVRNCRRRRRSRRRRTSASAGGR